MFAVIECRSTKMKREAKASRFYFARLKKRQMHARTARFAGKSTHILHRSLSCLPPEESASLINATISFQAARLSFSRGKSSKKSCHIPGKT